jgi:transcription initiation factor TFIID TATA-box-binding protein
MIEIVNVVASATIDQKLDLNDIVDNFPDVEYHPEQNPEISFWKG